MFCILVGALHWPSCRYDPARRFIGPQNFRRTCPGDLQAGGLGTDHSAHWSVRHYLPTGTKIDFSTLAALGQLAGVVFAATLFHGLIVLPAIAWLASDMNPLQFLRAVSQPMITALFHVIQRRDLATVHEHGPKNQVGKLTGRVAPSCCPLGATANMDGTALFEGIAAVFLAYMFGVELGATGVVAIFLVAMLSSVGAPGIPSGSMAGMQMVRYWPLAFRWKPSGCYYTERSLDTFRTAVNVEGDLVGCLVAKRFTA